MNVLGHPEFLWVLAAVSSAVAAACAVGIWLDRRTGS